MKLDDLLNEIERIKGPFKKYPFCFPQYPDVDLLIESSFLLAQYVKRYQEALEFYANGDSWTWDGRIEDDSCRKVKGQKAREALEWRPEVIMEMPEGWKVLDKITDEPTNRGACTGWPKKDARKYLDLMKEMAEALEQACALIEFKWGPLSAEVISGEDDWGLSKSFVAIQKFKDWK